MNVEKDSQNQQNPLNAARKFLLAIVAATPFLVGVPQGATGQERQGEISTSVLGNTQPVKDMGKELGGLAKERQAELKRAAELGPDVEKALRERFRVMDLMGETKVQIKRLEDASAAATDIETYKDSDMAKTFKEKNGGMTPAIFLRQASSIMERLNASFKLQEEQFLAAGDNYRALKEGAEKRLNTPK